LNRLPGRLPCRASLGPRVGMLKPHCGMSGAVRRGDLPELVSRSLTPSSVPAPAKGNAMKDMALRANQTGDGRLSMTGQRPRWRVSRRRNGYGRPSRPFRQLRDLRNFRSGGQALMRHLAQARPVAGLPIRVQATTTFGSLVRATRPSEPITARGAGALGPAVPPTVITATTQGKLPARIVSTADHQPRALDLSSALERRSRHDLTLNRDQHEMEAERTHSPGERAAGEVVARALAVFTDLPRVLAIADTP
jgi:hypothetical protein